MLYRHNIVLRC